MKQSFKTKTNKRNRGSRHRNSFVVLEIFYTQMGKDQNLC